MKRKLIFLLSLVMIFSLLTGCSSKFGDIPKEDRQVYEEVYQLYKYAEKMIDNDIGFTEMYKDKKFKQLTEKHIERDNYPNESLKQFKTKLLGIIVMHEDNKENKEFSKQQLIELKQNYSMFK